MGSRYTSLVPSRRLAFQENDPLIPRINNLHALRVFAALLVVFCHSGYRLGGLQPFGSFSVPMFFVISGFVMAMVATEQPKQFLQRRLLRAVPTYWLATLVIFFISVRLPLLFHSTRPNVTWLMKSLFFIPFEKAPGIIEPLVFVGWTMNCEIVLYLLIALGLKWMPKQVVWFTTAALLLFMVVCSTMASMSAAAFFYSRSAMLCFVFGLVAYPAWKKMGHTHARAMRWYAWGTLAFLSVGLCLMEGIGVAPYRTADSMYALRPLVSEVGSLLIVMSALVLAKVGFDIQSKGLMLLAESTFVLYLTHAYLLLGFARLGASVPALALTQPLGLLLMLLVVLAFGLGVHVFVEKPAMKVLKRVFLGGDRRPARAEVAEVTVPIAASPSVSV
jgi:exopolysaccharide production protein ExoZ